jgi:hypothetical protein
VDDFSTGACNGFGDHYLFDSGAFWMACDFCSEGYELVSVTHYGSAVDGGESGDSIDGSV